MSNPSDSVNKPSPFYDALLVEDELNLATAIKVALTKLGIKTEHVTTIESAKDYLKSQTPSLLVLDRTLPDGDGLTLCENIRAEFKGMILMLTARGEVSDRVQGLNAGADDYLPKPFSYSELDARIGALMRRIVPRDSKTQTVKIDLGIPGPAEGDGLPEEKTPWSLDRDRLRVLKPSTEGFSWVTLTPLEFKLASHLIMARGAIVTREDLLKDVWGFTLLPKTRTVDHFLGRLRKYFEENPEDPKHFLTVRGAGYRFEKF